MDDDLWNVPDVSYYSSDEYRIKERILARLHERAGVCAHCGKRDCAGRQSNSNLPMALSRADVLYALQLDVPEITGGSDRG